MIAVVVSVSLGTGGECVAYTVGAVGAVGAVVGAILELPISKNNKKRLQIIIIIICKKYAIHTVTARAK